MKWYKQRTTWLGIIQVAQVVTRYADGALSLEAMVNGILLGLAFIAMQGAALKPNGR